MSSNELTEQEALEAVLVESAADNGLWMGGLTAEAMASTILAAGYSKSRTITTAEELNALPVGSVVLCRGRSWQRYEPRKVDSLGFYSPYAWQCPDGGFVRSTKDGWTILPATVLYAPEPQP